MGRVDFGSSPSFDVWAADKAVRFYAHDTALAAFGNTFPGAHVTSIDRPLWQFRSVGSVAENAKQANWAIERELNYLDNVSQAFKTRSGRKTLDLDFDITTSFYTYTVDPSKVNAGTGFGGITIFDPTPGYGADHVRLVQYLDDPAKWELVSNVSGVITTKAFTIPSSAVDCGHVISLRGNVVGENIKAYVDGVFYASLGLGEVPQTSASAMMIGITLYSGTQTGATSTHIGLAATRITNYGVTT